MYVQYSSDNMFHVKHCADLPECSTWNLSPFGLSDGRIQNRQSKISNRQFLSVFPVFSVY